MTKFQRMIQTLPAFYQPEVNTILGGLLQAWAIEDDIIVEQIAEVKKSIFVATAEGRYLDLLGNNVGVSRSPSLGIDDSDFRQLIPVLSFKPKQVRSTIVDLLDAFWGPTFTRANVNSGNTETYNFGPATTLTGTVIFLKDNNIVKGTGTAFLLEVQPGDYIKPNSATGTQYSKVSKVLDDETIELSLPWEFDIALNVVAAKGVTRWLEYRVDDRTTKTIRFIPNAFADLTAVTIEELIIFVNNHYEHRDYISADDFLDPISGSKLNLRTNTPGILGSIQILDGDANDPTRLNFPLTLNSQIRAGVFEINANELIILIPSSVPVLRRTLKGAVHPKKTKTELFSLDEVFDFSGLGASSTLNISVNGSPQVITFTHASDFEDASAVTAEEVARVINGQATNLFAATGGVLEYKSVGLRTANEGEDYQVTGGTANAVLGFSTTLQEDPDLIIPNYPSSYVFDPFGATFTVTSTKSTLASSVSEGTLSSTLNLTDAASFPNTTGRFILDFGRSTQEGPIRYNSRPNNSTLLIDASYVFQKNHDAGSTINFVLDSPTEPRTSGDDYAAYVVGTEEARIEAQNLVRKLLAAGVVVRFIIQFPEVLFECVCRDCGPSTNADQRGSLTGSGPLVF